MQILGYLNLQCVKIVICNWCSLMCTVYPRDLASSKIFKLVSIKHKSSLRNSCVHPITTSNEHSVAGVE